MKNASIFALASVIVALAGCGGTNSDSSKPANAFAAQITQAGVSPTLVASDYATIVQQLYVSYFGRPADTGGFASFKGQMAEIGAPNDIQLLLTAYSSDARVRSLIDSFGSSAESAALYGGDNTTFVTAIYTNVLGRAPDAEGLAFWVGEINSGKLTRARASLDILAGALKNTSAQGQLDAALVNKKITVALSFTNTLIAAPVNGYSGDAAAARARTMLSSLTASTSTATYEAAINTVVSDLAALVPSWSLRAPMTTWLGQSIGVNFLVSGMCTGSVSEANGAPSQVAFDGSTRTAVATVSVWQFTNCSPATFNATESTYYDSNYSLVGSAVTTLHTLSVNGTEFVTFAQPANALPATVRIGDTGTIGVATVYTTSAKTSTTGSRTYSYAIEADDGSSTTAIANFRTLSTNGAGAPLLTLQTKYRLNANATLSLIAQDIQFATTSTIHLVKKAQPTALSGTDTVVGTGEVVVAGKTVTVHYTGWLYDPTVGNRHGAQFDSSIGKSPFAFKSGAGGVISGWDQGVLGMRVGGKRTLIIPSNLGYGTTGAGASIPPNAGLVFDVEVISVQ
jgi:FKBP-type peptidyl-prolyl cis-trans isomerase